MKQNRALKQERHISRMKEASSAKQQFEKRFVNERAVHPGMMTSAELHNSLYCDISNVCANTSGLFVGFT
jgi:hypothetical protein